MPPPPPLSPRLELRADPRPFFCVPEAYCFRNLHCCRHERLHSLHFMRGRPVLAGLQRRVGRHLHFVSCRHLLHWADYRVLHVPGGHLLLRRRRHHLYILQWQHLPDSAGAGWVHLFACLSCRRNGRLWQWLLVLSSKLSMVLLLSYMPYWNDQYRLQHQKWHKYLLLSRKLLLLQ